MYYFKALDAQNQVVTGSWDGSDGGERAVVAYLQGRELTPLRIQTTPFTVHVNSTPVVRSQNRASTYRFRRGSVTTRDLISFAEDVGVLLGAGVALSRALVILIELHTSRRAFARELRLVHDDMREGSTFWEALERRGGVFPPIFVNMVRAGESGGALPTILERLAGYLQEMQELKDYLKATMIYPVILSFTSLASMILMLTLVVPKFAGVFQDMGMELPATTEAMFLLGIFLKESWWMVALSVVILGVAVWFALRVKRWRLIWDRLLLRLPVFGVFVRKIEVARFCRTLGTLLESGVSILPSMQIVRGVVFNTVLDQAVGLASQDLKHGDVLSRALEKTGQFPLLCLNMIGVGEETGRLGPMLDKVGQLYEKELRKGIRTFSSLFEPLVLLVMGLLIGGMVISMLMAIFSINDMQL